MDNHILFPYNYEVYVNKGMVAWQSGNAQLAADYFRKALSIRQSEDVLLFYLMVIPETGTGKEAVAFLRQSVPGLWHSRALRDVDRLFIELLLLTENLEDAKQQIKLRRLMPGDPQEDLLLLMEDRLQNLQDSRQEERRQLYQQLLKEKEHIHSNGFLAMNAFLMHCKELPDQAYASLCLSFLSDLRIHPFHKTEILEELLRRQVQVQCSVSKGSFHKLIDIGDLLPVAEAPFFQAGIRLLRDREDWTEETRKALEQNLFLHAAYYYPFEQDALHSARTWLEAVGALQQEGELGNIDTTPVCERIHAAETAMNELAGL